MSKCVDMCFFYVFGACVYSLISCVLWASGSESFPESFCVWLDYTILHYRVLPCRRDRPCLSLCWTAYGEYEYFHRKNVLGVKMTRWSTPNWMISPCSEDRLKCSNLLGVQLKKHSPSVSTMASRMVVEDQTHAQVSTTWSSYSVLLAVPLQREATPGPLGEMTQHMAK